VLARIRISDSLPWTVLLELGIERTKLPFLARQNTPEMAVKASKKRLAGKKNPREPMAPSRGHLGG
jgi:hypothetical protein